MKILTNNHPRPMLALVDLPAEAQECFDHITDDLHGTRFVKYRGHWYDTYDTWSWHGDRKEWHSYEPDSYFSGVLFRLVGDHEVIVGRYYA
jgi:hypothetical protein